MPPSRPARVHVEAVRTAGETGSTVPVEADATANTVVLDLGKGAWHVQAWASGYWSQGAEFVVASQAPTGVQLTLWPASSLHGEVTTMGGEPPPHFLEVRLSATPASAVGISNPQESTSSSKSNPSHAELHCAIDRGMWSCLGPAGVFDVRLEASGYAPGYQWHKSLNAAESTDLGRTVLRQAASVFGRAVLKDGSDPPGPCRAILQPDLERHGLGDSGGESSPANEPSSAVPLSEHGYFQFVGVLPGRHLLTVKCQAASGFRELSVETNGETRIGSPLLLEELTLDIALTPKLDPKGQPWQLTIDMTAPLYRRIANKIATSADGRWLRRGLTAGNYRATVSSSDGALWLQKYFDLRPESAPVALRLASVSVAGRVTLSSQPVRARLVFVNDSGGQSVALTSDDNGRFQGLLPVTPNVQETNTWTVEAHVAQPSVNQRLLGVSVPTGGSATTWLDLELPTIAVRGSVVSNDGQLQRDVQVTFEDSRGLRTTTATDNAGNFELPDLQPGKYTAVADSLEGVSDRTPVDVMQGIGSVVKLVLNLAPRVRFSVVSDQGPVPDAAVQVWIKPGVPRAFVRTDQDGHFDVRLPPDIKEIGVTVGAPGYALKLVRLPIPSASEGDESPDANTISLSDSGGKLKLNFRPPGRTAESSGALYLVHNRAIQDARTVTGWGTDQAGASGNGPAVVESIEPGSYALCLIADQAQLAALWSGPPPSDRCRSGSVEQDGALTLSPP